MATAAGRLLIIAGAILVFLSLCAKISQAQAGVCNRRVTRYRVSYRTATIYYSTSCGFWYWARCQRSRNERRSFVQAYDVDLFECCSGFTTCGPNSDSCCQNTNCTNGDVRLVGGSNPLEGRVEVCYYNQWGTVCDDSWSTLDARVVCSQLGYSPTSAVAYSRAGFGEGAGPIVMDDVRCTGNEGKLMECQSSLSHNCGHYQDAGVRCTLSTYGCTSGDVRLAGSGSSSTQGRVELCHNNQWGTICDDGWDDNDAEVTCKQLKYTSHDAVGESRAIFGQGSGSIWLSDVGCNGTERSLLDCPAGALGSHICSHTEDAGVRCNTNCTDGDLRLSGGRNGTEGRVEMCNRGEWGTVCGDMWDGVDAQVVCNQLGFSDTGAVTVSTFIGGTGSILLDDINCFGNESRLVDCTHNGLGVHNCTHSNDAGVRCLRLSSDINECEEDIDGCAQMCTDIVSGYTCSCQSGYRLASDSHGCDDINECSSRSTHDCAHICANTFGSYTCSCRSGYRLLSNGRSCRDIDECSEGISGCAQTCTNTIGSYRCSCGTNFILATDGHGCEDIDECSDDSLHSCEQLCNNTHGSHNCFCFEGYELSTDGFSCNDVDECAENIDGCAQTCFNTEGSYACSCNAGYRLAGDRHGCDDVNECIEGEHNCHQQAHTVCTNTIGSYTCDCQSGFTLDGLHCTDVDECVANNVCDHSCTNTAGSFLCDCRRGFTKTLNQIGCLGSPGNVTLNARSSRSLSMTWTSPGNLKAKHGSFIAYSVKCRSKGQLTATYTLENVTQVIVDQCLPYSTYNCCVSLQTTQANSTAVCQQQRTPEDAPGTAPRITFIDNSNPYSIVVHWSAPLTPNGVITRYTLYIGYEGGAIDVLTTDGESTSYNVTNLQPHQLISIEVTASTRIGEGPSSVNEIRTAQAPPQEVTGVMVDVISNGSIQVEWGPPARANGILTYYTITVVNQRTGFNFSSRVNASESEATTVSGLRPFIPYTVQVFASTEAGQGNPVTSLIYTRHGVPAIPTLKSVKRLSGSTAMINWIPLTQTEARGFLTDLEIAYEPVVDSKLNCSSYNFIDSKKVFVRDNLFELSTTNITGLEPNRVYCIAIQVSTSGGESGYSNAIELPLQQGAPFQIKFSLPDDLKCSNFIDDSAKEKTTSVSQFIAQQVTQLCQCRYSSSFIVSSRLLCTTKNDVVYQAEFLSTDDKTALEIRNTTQLWVLTNPIIAINEQFYRVDPYCSIIVKQLGVISCNSDTSTEATLTDQQSFQGMSLVELASIIAVGSILVLVSILAFILVCCCICNKRKPKKNDIQQQSSLDRAPPPPCQADEGKGIEYIHNPLYRNFVTSKVDVDNTEHIYEAL